MSEEVQKPDAATFDLGAWVQGKATYPRFTTTVYLDQDAAAKAAALNDTIKELTKKADKAYEASMGSQPNASLVDTATASHDHQKYKQERDKAVAEQNKYVEQLKKSALTLVFGVKDRNHQKNVNTALKEKFPQLKDHSEQQILKAVQEDEEIATAQAYLRLKETLVEITNADGHQVDMSQVTVDQITNLVESLPAKSQSRVHYNMMQAVTGGNVVDEAIDAGFPG